MQKKIEKLKGFRQFLLNQIEPLSPWQLNTIPIGFNNNIIWNLAHMICVEQNTCYVRSGLPILIEDQYFSPYMPGTKPEGFIDEQDIRIIKKMFLSSIDSLQANFDKNLFVNYSPSSRMPQVYGFEVNNIEDAIEALLYHDGTHFGVILSLKHIV